MFNGTCSLLLPAIDIDTDFSFRIQIPWGIRNPNFMLCTKRAYKVVYGGKLMA